MAKPTFTRAEFAFINLAHSDGYRDAADSFDRYERTPSLADLEADEGKRATLTEYAKAEGDIRPMAIDEAMRAWARAYREAWVESAKRYEGEDDSDLDGFGFLGRGFIGR